MKRIVYLSAGHSTQEGKDRGASGNRKIEGIVSAEFRQLLVTELNRLGVTVMVDGNHTVLADSLAWIKRFVTPGCIAIDIHCNAAGEAATGTEVIVPAKPSAFEKGLASELSGSVAFALGIRNRGVKLETETARKRLGWMAISAQTVLIELFFISNKFDCKAYDEKKHIAAKRTAEVISKWANQ